MASPDAEMKEIVQKKGFNLNTTSRKMRILLALGCLSLVGCQDDFEELPTEFDTIGEIIGFTLPDTVQSATNVRVQMSFPRLCGGEFNGVKRYDNNNTIRLTPAIHVVAQSVCPAVVTFLTVTETIRFPSAGEYTVVGYGRYWDIPKKVVVLSSYSASQHFIFRYKFLKVNGQPSANQVAEFSLPGKLPPVSFQVQSDSNGVWEMTMPDTVPQLRYRLAGLDFVAMRGIKEDGIIYVQ